MATTPVEPIFVLTEGGHYAIITAIDPGSDDCFEGYLLVAGNDPQVFRAEWSRSGRCRDREQSANVVISRSESLGKLLEVVTSFANNQT